MACINKLVGPGAGTGVVVENSSLIVLFTIAFDDSRSSGKFSPS